MGEREIAGRYVLEEPIGRGGMGRVWRAHDKTLRRNVALKEVLLPASDDADEAEIRYRRLEREAQIAGRVSHPGIVTVHDVFRDEYGRPWIVMQYVPSQSLHDLVAAQGPLTALRAGRIGQQILDALAEAHAEGVLHRDVKPSNVLIAQGRPGDRAGGRPEERAVLTDFGIALFEGDTRMTQADQVLHSVGFTAPERYEGVDATPASDLWSLGATLFAAVEGHGPFDRETETTTMVAVVREPPPTAPSAGPLLGQLIAALLNRDPAARPSAAAAARMLAENLPLMAGEAGQLSFLSVPPPGQAPTAPAPAAESTEPAEPGEPEQPGPPWPALQALPAPITPTQTSDPQLIRVSARPIPPGSPLTASADPPPSASDLLRQFDWETGGSAPAASRVSARRPARKPALIAGGSLAAAALAVAVFVFANHDSGHKAAGSAATHSLSTSPTVSAGGSPSASSSAGPLPDSTSPAMVGAINDPNMTTSPGYISKPYTAGEMGTHAGFVMSIPPGWHAVWARGQQQVYFYGPAEAGAGAGAVVEVDLAPDVKTTMMAEAEYLKTQDHAKDYQQRLIAGSGKKFIQPVIIHHAPGALYQFDWTDGQTTMRVNELLFTELDQPYRIYTTGPAGGNDKNWNNVLLKTIEKMLKTFDVLPA